MRCPAPVREGGAPPLAVEFTAPTRDRARLTRPSPTRAKRVRARIVAGIRQAGRVSVGRFGYHLARRIARSPQDRRNCPFTARPMAAHPACGNERPLFHRLPRLRRCRQAAAPFGQCGPARGSPNSALRPAEVAPVAPAPAPPPLAPRRADARIAVDPAPPRPSSPARRASRPESAFSLLQAEQRHARSTAARQSAGYGGPAHRAVPPPDRRAASGAPAPRSGEHRAHLRVAGRPWIPDPQRLQRGQPFADGLSDPPAGPPHRVHATAVSRSSIRHRGEPTMVRSCMHVLQVRHWLPVR